MDGGANICLTGVLDLLVDVVTIASLPISVVTKTGDISMDDCCTKKGLILLFARDRLQHNHNHEFSDTLINQLFQE